MRNFKNDAQMKKTRGKTRTDFVCREKRASAAQDKYRKENKSLYGNGAGFHGYDAELGHNPEMVYNAESITRETVFDDSRHLIGYNQETKDFYFKKHGQASKEGVYLDSYFVVQQTNKITGSKIAVSHILRRGEEVKDGSLPYRLSPMNKKMRREYDAVMAHDNLRPSDVYENVILSQHDNLFQTHLAEYDIMVMAKNNKDMEEFKNFQRRHYDGEEIYKSRAKHLYHEFLDMAYAYIDSIVVAVNPEFANRAPLFGEAPKRFYVTTNITFTLNGKRVQTTPYDLLSGQHDDKIRKALKLTVSQRKDAYIERFLQRVDILTEDGHIFEEAVNVVNSSIENGTLIFDGFENSNLKTVTLEEINDKIKRDKTNEEYAFLDQDVLNRFVQGKQYTILIANKAKSKVIASPVKKENLKGVNPLLVLFGYNQSAMNNFMKGVSDFSELEFILVEGSVDVPLKKAINPYNNKKLFDVTRGWLNLDPSMARFNNVFNKQARECSDEEIIAKVSNGSYDMTYIINNHPDLYETALKVSKRKDKRDLRDRFVRMVEDHAVLDHLMNNNPNGLSLQELCKKVDISFTHVFRGNVGKDHYMVILEEAKQHGLSEQDIIKLRKNIIKKRKLLAM